MKKLLHALAITSVAFIAIQQQLLAQGEVQNTGTGPFWKTIGNANTNPAGNYIGTTDNQPLVVSTNATEQMRVLANGNVGIGTTTPDTKLDVHGKTTISRDGQTECCSNDATLALAEATTGTARRASISFHNAGESEGQLRLIQNAVGSVNTNSRRIQLFDNQAVGLGLELSGGLFYGSQNSRTWTRTNAGLQGNAGAQSGLFENDGATVTNFYTGASGWQHMIDVRHSNPANNYALQLAGSFFDQELWFRKTNNNPATAWSRVISSSNLNNYAWTTLGNSGTNAAVNFIGTTDGVDWVMRTSNAERARITAGGNVGIGTTTPAVRLAINGAGVNVYATDMWVENNIHVQGNENIVQGGRSRMRIGNAWNYVGLYAETSSTGAGNDLVVGASSGFTRVGPFANSNQHLQWSNSILRDDQGGSMEIGGNDIRGFYGNGTPYIDWHVADGYSRDFDVRQMASWDAYGPVMNWTSFVGTTIYPFFELDWIGSYDNWADVSAWRYWANSTNWLYQDVQNDLDLIDSIRPKTVIDPKSKESVVINDPLSTPSYITKASKRDNGEYIYDMGAVLSLNTGAIRQLRTETKTANEGQNARIERLEKIVEELSGKKLDRIVFVAEGMAPKGLNRYVVMDGRLSCTSKITVTFKNPVGSYYITDQTNGSFTLVFDNAIGADAAFNYSSTLK